MAKCPSCHADIEDDIGLVTCAACGAQVLLELDGTASTAPVRTSTAVDYSLPQENIHPAELVAINAVNTSENFFDQPEIEAPSSLDLSEPQVMSEDSVQATSGDSMQEVVDFANSESSLGRDGALRFHVSIFGIDSTEIRKSVFEVLSDGRFLWDANQLLAKVQNGQLVVRDLTSIKAALLVQRLRGIPVEIYWEQYAIHQ